MRSLRFDKRGRRLLDTGHGCGCQQCADAQAPRYERRRAVAALGARRRWSSLRRRLTTLFRRPAAPAI